ncbi:hypothetical protein GR160_07600 [Flavobacterium sp. Sd200]|uniref:hypothetical protein n=1 Tax=Flavobacterium sp. Sd200 TaxID=2692211 RepID=UPI00144ED9CF|nr:hypothetical protein [Flavobacterium sp. Sd200]MXN91092.1 hypothetical protein [Flavobacterium sp. Sd200]
MKKIVVPLVWVTWACLLGFVIWSVLGMAYPLLFGVFIIGHVLILFMVYKVLASPYTSTKKFKHWYEDHTRTTVK